MGEEEQTFPDSMRVQRVFNDGCFVANQTPNDSLYAVLVSFVILIELLYQLETTLYGLNTRR